MLFTKPTFPFSVLILVHPSFSSIATTTSPLSILSTVFEKKSAFHFTDRFDFAYAFTCFLVKESNITLFSTIVVSKLYTSFISTIGIYITSSFFIACAYIFLVAPFKVNLFVSNPILAICLSYVVTISFISSSIFIYLSK